METIRDLLQREMEQLNEYARTMFQVYVGWFTFFITVLMAAMATGIRASMEGGKVKYPWTAYTVGVLFLVQIILGIWISIEVHNELAGINTRIEAITTNLTAVASMTNAPATAYIAPQSPLPDAMPVALLVATITLVSNIIFWGVLLMIISRWHKKQITVAPVQLPE